MKKKLFTILMAVFALVFVVSGAMVISYTVTSRQQAKVYNELGQIMSQAEASAPAEEPITVTDPQGQEATMLPEFAELYEKNPDITGWLRIEGTKLDYPVMYKPDSEDYYLRRNFYGEKATHGCLYIEETCEVTSDNVTIYGHNMRDGSMFAVLQKYDKKSFWEQHPVVQFNTLTEKAQYEIFAVFITTSSVGKGFKYHQYIDFTSQESFDTFVNTCRELSFYDTGITPTYGDTFITLSTCDKALVNGRMVVVARKMAE